MSGPVTIRDAAPDAQSDEPQVCDVEVIDGRDAEVGGFAVRRVLPRRQRRTVGAWCFADHMGPGSTTATHGLDIGPHPHIGLQTATWLVQGAMLHRDSLGSEQIIRPGQLNLMTAGHGVAHSEETTGVHRGSLHGIQLWVAQPSTTRDGEPAFEHHATLPQAAVDHGVATVLVGAFLDAVSPARRDTDHVAVELALEPGASILPLDRAYEYGLAVLDGSVKVGDCPVDRRSLGYLGVGRDELAVEVVEPATLLLIGGRPFPEPLLMWWNYVARTQEEVTAAHRAWTDRTERFGAVSSALAPIFTADPPWA